MPLIKLIVDSGSTKAEWCVLSENQPISYFTSGLSPYFLNESQIVEVIVTSLLPQIGSIVVDEIYFYGTGCKNPINKAFVKSALLSVFPNAYVEVDHDLMGAARGLCGNSSGIACILGTGSNSCFYDGEIILKNSPGLGYILGDEGSGAYLGKRVLQYYLYKTFDDELLHRFDEKFNLKAEEILDKIYKQPLANRYMATFAMFLQENRGHYMVENIIEDGINDFFFNHLLTYKENNEYPIHFLGSVAFGFQDVIRSLGDDYGFTIGKIVKNPIAGLIEFHQ
jgi:N-acetylglucosamine kinase-like BadF-type ATPase